MNTNPKIWYPAKRYGGGLTQILPDAEAHILYHGIFLCRKTPAQVVIKLKADTGSVRSGVIPGNPMCEICKEAYKNNPDFPYWKWSKMTKSE